MVQSFRPKKAQYLVDCNKSPLGKNPEDHASNMRVSEYQFHTTVEKVWVALLSFVLLSYLLEEGKARS